jgi:ABC-type sugar transport system permease subunit
MFSQIFNPDQGTINWVLNMLGMLKINPDTKLLMPVDWLHDGAYCVPMLIIVCFWQWTGFHMVYFLSQLQTIDPNLYEAARIDGASQTQIMTKITLPLMRPAVAFVMITSLIGGFLIFDIIYILFDPGIGSWGTGNHAKLLMPYVYQNGFNVTPPQTGFASAAGWFVFAIIAVINIIQIRVLGLGSSREQE